MKVPSNIFSLVVFGWLSTMLSLPAYAGVAFDYDGDEKADLAVRRNSNSLQYISNSSDFEIERIAFGRQPGDVPVSGDFDGDGIYDIAIRRSANHTWYIINSSGIDALTNHEDGISRVTFGRHMADIPVPADYDGDGKTDLAVRRPSNQYWYIRNSSGVDAISGNSDGITRVRFGLQAADIPVPADYDGDGKADLAVRRPSSQLWYIRNSTGADTLTGHDDGISRVSFGGQATDIPVVADYDGDGKADIAVRRPATFQWYIQNSSGIDAATGHSDGISRIVFGRDRHDIPVIADYDGDGKADIAVRRPATHTWYVRNSAGIDLRTNNNDGITRARFGLQAQDIPLAQPLHLIWLVSDIDNDGLSNQQEMTLGTDITNADSDNDGLTDGEEVNEHQTDPLNADSDGDGRNDGDEVAVGTDPNTVDAPSIENFKSRALVGLQGRLSFGDRMVEGFLAPYNDAMHLGADNIATHFFNGRGGNPHASYQYRYAAETETQLVFSTLGLQQEQYSCHEIEINNIDTRFPEEIVNEILRLCDANVFDTGVFTLESGISEIRWELVESRDKALLVDVHRTFRDAVVLSETEQGFWTTDIPLFKEESLATERFEFVYHFDNLKDTVLAEGMTGSWVLPLRYDPNSDDISNIANHRFIHDLIKIDSDRGLGNVSGLEFTVTHNNASFILETKDHSFVYTPLQKLANIFMVRVDHYQNGEFLHTFIGNMAKQADTNDVSEFSPVTKLPIAYNAVSSTFDNWLNVGRENGQPKADSLFAYQFKADGSVTRLINHFPNLYDPERFYFSDWHWETQNDSGALLQSTSSSSRFRDRYWQIIETSLPEKFTVFEYEISGNDDNNDGKITDNETSIWVHPRLNVIQRVDLSAYGELWDNTDFDHDGLTNEQETELGTDFDNPDTDADGYSDYEEIIGRSDPTDSTSVPLKLGDLSFNDENLSACLLGYYSADTFVGTINSVFCTGNSVSNLEGMGQLFAVTAIYLDNNVITDLSPLSQLSQLELVRLTNNNIVDISPLSELTELKSLFLGNNQINDITSLTNLENLHRLDLTQNNVSDISPLAALLNLTDLQLAENQIADISALQNLSKLEILDLASNNITSLEALLNLSMLQTLVLMDNDNANCGEIYQIEANMFPNSLTAPDSCPGEALNTAMILDGALAACIQSSGVELVRELLSLNCENAGVTDISGLDHFFALRDIILNNNQITVFPEFREFKNIRNIALENNSIDNIENLAIHSNLAELSLEDNQLSDITHLETLTELWKLNLGNNQITDISALHNLRSLTELELFTNQISDISPLEELSNISLLSLSGNQISDISPIEGMPFLRILFLSDNDISDLSSISNFAIQHTFNNLLILTLGGNPINDFSPVNDLNRLIGLGLVNLNLTDISFLVPRSGLTQLHVSNNNLTSLHEFSAFPDIFRLSVDNNQITDLSPLQELQSLISLSIAGNGLEDITHLASNRDSLSTLNLKQNSIAIIDALFELEQLSEVDLSENIQIVCSDITRLEEQFPEASIIAPEHCNGGEQPATKNTKDVPFSTSNDEFYHWMVEYDKVGQH